MNKKSKILVLSVLVCLGSNNIKILCSSDNTISGEIRDSVINIYNNTNSDKNFDLDKYETRVYDANSLAVAVTGSENNTKIICDNDITLDRNIKIEKSIKFDLNGHKIKLVDKAKFIIGNKFFDHTVQKTVYHPGRYMPNYTTRYVTNENGEKYKSQKETSWIWEPGWNETVSEPVYKYLDDLDIVFENGEIYGSDGTDGKHGKPYTFFSCFGETGTSGVAAIDIISGTVRTRNMRITGGNGGNGGNGATEAIMHIPFISGNAGSGGRGGRAAAAVILRRQECKLRTEKNSIISSGLPGFGGIGGTANPNHWIGHGKDGKDGNNGKTSEAIYKKYEHSIF